MSASEQAPARTTEEKAAAPVRRLLWDCSHVASLPHLNTGIERVVRELGAALLAEGPALGFEVIPCVTDGTAEIRRVDIPQVSDAPPVGLEPVVPAAGDVWVLADHAWDPARLIGISPWWRQGMRVLVFQYDLVPLLRPDTTTPLTAALFGQWLFEAVAFADAFVSISRATRAALVAQLDACAPWRTFSDAELPVVHLGARWQLDRPDPKPQPGEPWRILAVGTIEPRKRYGQVLDAFEEHWRRGGRTELRIVGRKGWNSGPLQRRLSALDESEARFKWLSDIDDDGLREQYAWARALVSLSSDEGFGLPVIEGAAAGLPLILTDIPVYREIAGTQAQFLAAEDDSAGKELADLLDALDAGQGALPDPPEDLARRTWQDAARDLLSAVEALPTPHDGLRERWDHRAALAVAAFYLREAPGDVPGPTGPPVAATDRPRPAARQRFAASYSRLRLRLPRLVVRVMHARNQLFRLAQQLDSRTSVLEARIAGLAKVYPTANALQSIRAAEAEQILRFQLEAVISELEKLVDELSSDVSLPTEEYRARIAAARHRLRARDDG